MAEASNDLKCRVCKTTAELTAKAHDHGHVLHTKNSRLMNLCAACFPKEKARITADLAEGRRRAGLKRKEERAAAPGTGVAGPPESGGKKQRRKKASSTAEKTKAVALDLQSAFQASCKAHSLPDTQVRLVYYVCYENTE